jgi:hypothetical protein
MTILGLWPEAGGGIYQRKRLELTPHKFASYAGLVDFRHV